MRRIKSLIAVVSVVMSISALVGGTALAQAQSETSAVSFPFTVEGFNSCNDEYFTIEGDAHYIEHATYDNEGAPHYHATLRAVGEGVGEYGSRYISQITISSTSNGVLFDPSAAESTIASSFPVIRLGEDGTREDLLAHGTLHVTQNASGEVTAYFDVANIDCR